jgi:uncharacterized membrane protein YkvA (DUF1232 family)
MERSGFVRVSTCSNPEGVAMYRIFRLWRLSGRDLRILIAAARHPNRPHWLIPALLALAFFTLEPLNFAAPMVGLMDDLVLLPLLIRILARLAEPRIARERGAAGAT